MSKIDYDTFNKLKERMKAKFSVLLEGFLRDAKNYVATIHTNIPDGDLNQIIESAHSLKSASGLLGLTHVHAHAETLEYKGKDMLKTGAEKLHDLQSSFYELQNAFYDVEGDLLIELEKLK